MRSRPPPDARNPRPLGGGAGASNGDLPGEQVYRKITLDRVAALVPPAAPWAAQPRTARRPTREVVRAHTARHPKRDAQRADWQRLLRMVEAHGIVALHPTADSPAVAMVVRWDGAMDLLVAFEESDEAAPGFTVDEARFIPGSDPDAE